MEALLKDGAILDFIPQRPPFVMVDKLYKLEGAKATTGLLITAENTLVAHGHLQESGLVENMAQSAALLAGYHARESGSKPNKGFIGMIKDLKIYALPKTGQEIFTEVENSAQIMNAQIVKGRVMDSAQHVLAECELRIFFENDETDK